MILCEDYAKEILSAMSFAASEGCLDTNEVLSELLGGIARHYPNLRAENNYFYYEYASHAWWALLTKEQRRELQDRPKMPEGWWPGGRTLKTGRPR